ncbi:MAG: hypothetical protein AAGG46_02155 [Planctomycetota bacterium]
MTYDEWKTDPESGKCGRQRPPRHRWGVHFYDASGEWLYCQSCVGESDALAVASDAGFVEGAASTSVVHSGRRVSSHMFANKEAA